MRRPTPKYAGEKHDQVIMGPALTLEYNFYSYEHSKTDAVKFLVMWLTAQGRTSDAHAVEKSSETIVSQTAGWVARLLTNGNTLPQASTDYLNKAVQEVVEKFAIKEIQKAVAPHHYKPNVQQNIHKKATSIIDTFEAWFSVVDYDMCQIFVYNDLTESKPKVDVTKHIMDYFKDVRAEHVAPDAKEIYRHLSKPELLNRIEFYDEVIRQVVKYQEGLDKPVKRAYRKRKY